SERDRRRSGQWDELSSWAQPGSMPALTTTARGGRRQSTAGASNDGRILEVQSGQRLLHRAVLLENKDAPVLVYRSLLDLYNRPAHRHGGRGDSVDLVAGFFLVETDLAAHPVAPH